MVQRKGVIYLLEAFRMIAHKFPQAELEFVGGGPEVQTTLSFIKNNHLEKQIKYRGKSLEIREYIFFRKLKYFALLILTKRLLSPYLKQWVAVARSLGFKTKRLKNLSAHIQTLNFWLNKKTQKHLPRH